MLGRAFTSYRNALAQGTPTPAFRCAIDFPMREKRIRHFSDLLALPRHDVYRVVQKNAADLGGGLAHENLGTREASGGHRQCADVVLMRMRNENRIDLTIGDCLE